MNIECNIFHDRLCTPVGGVKLWLRDRHLPIPPNVERVIFDGTDFGVIRHSSYSMSCYRGVIKEDTHVAFVNTERFIVCRTDLLKFVRMLCYNRTYILHAINIDKIEYWRLRDYDPGPHVGCMLGESAFRPFNQPISMPTANNQVLKVIENKANTEAVYTAIMKVAMPPHTLRQVDDNTIICTTGVPKYIWDITKVFGFPFDPIYSKVVHHHSKFITQ